MKTTARKIRFLSITAIAFALSMNNFAFSKGLQNAPANYNVAVVDVQKIIENSPEINALKIAGKAKLGDLASFAEKARAEVAKETNVAKKKTLEEAYNKELNDRKSALETEYSKKLSDIDKNITLLINTKAKASGYDLVLVKSNVLDGGTDITADIIKELK